MSTHWLLEARWPGGARRWSLTRSPLIIGRGQDCDIVIPVPQVSRRHARLDRLTDGWMLTDLGSRNGLKASGSRVERTMLGRGDRVSITGPQGDLVLTLLRAKEAREPDGVGEVAAESGSQVQSLVVDLRDRPTWTVGRAPACDIVIESMGSSRRHATVTFGPEGVIVQDLGSSNGVWQGGRRVNLARLGSGDHVTIGEARLSAHGPLLKVMGVAASVSPPSDGPAREQGADRMMPRLGKALATLAAAVLVIGFAAYVSVAAELPDPATLRARLATFRSALIQDRHGSPLAEAFDPNMGRRTLVSLDEIAPTLRQATIATEDARFYLHSGYDPRAIIRALWQAAQGGEWVSGASTIPQQLVKIAFLSPERSMRRKFKEVILAAEISRRYTKDEILELYLNEICYANLACGIEAASLTYFNKHAAELTLAEAALLAGLPQAPAYYDPYTHPERAKRRQETVLSLMVQSGYASPSEAKAASEEVLEYQPSVLGGVAPHFVLLVRQQLEERFGPEVLYRRGLIVTTALDIETQKSAEGLVRSHVTGLSDRGVSNGALVALRPASGDVLALVGSDDFADPIDGQINMAVVPRQPGSTLKPFVYLAAVEARDLRWTPGTLLADIAEDFVVSGSASYRPVNYDGREHGMVTVRAALANSYNIPAVRALQAVTIPRFRELARRLGLHDLDRDDVGLPMALGAAEVPLLDLTGAYAMLANGGRPTRPVFVLRVEDGDGQILCDQQTASPCVKPASTSALREEDAFVVTDILSDNAARGPAFGLDSPLVVDRPAAVKTGTTNDFRDNLTVGYTPEVVVGVWVGNSDNTPMDGSTGVTGAAPIWHDFMVAFHREIPAKPFEPPTGARRVTVCADTGTLPSAACPEQATWWFAQDRLPLPASQDLWQSVTIDKRNGLRAHATTPQEQIETRVFKLYPDAYQAWAIAQGIPQPPSAESPPDPPVAVISRPADGESVSGDVLVHGSAGGPGFTGYRLLAQVMSDDDSFVEHELGIGSAEIVDGVLGTWDTSDVPPGRHALRLDVDSSNGASARFLRWVVVGATESPSPTPTNAPPSETPSPSATAQSGTGTPPVTLKPAQLRPTPSRGRR